MHVEWIDMGPGYAYMEWVWDQFACTWNGYGTSLSVHRMDMVPDCLYMEQVCGWTVCTWNAYGIGLSVHGMGCLYMDLV